MWAFWMLLLTIEGVMYLQFNVLFKITMYFNASILLLLFIMMIMSYQCLFQVFMRLSGQVLGKLQRSFMPSYRSLVWKILHYPAHASVFHCCPNSNTKTWLNNNMSVCVCGWVAICWRSFTFELLFVIVTVIIFFTHVLGVMTRAIDTVLRYMYQLVPERKKY